MGEQPPTRRRVPGGALPRSYARPRAPTPNGREAPPAPAQAWERLDAEEGPAESTRFRRVAEVVPDAGVSASGRPATVVVVATLVVVAVVVLAVVLYRMAPP